MKSLLAVLALALALFGAWLLSEGGASGGEGLRLEGDDPEAVVPDASLTAPRAAPSEPRPARSVAADDPSPDPWSPPEGAVPLGRPSTP